MYVGILAILCPHNLFGPFFRLFTRKATERHFDIAIHQLGLSVCLGVVGGTKVEMSPLQFQ